MTNFLSQKYFSVLSLGVRQHYKSHHAEKKKKKLPIFMTMLRNSCIFCKSRFSKSPQTNKQKKLRYTSTILQFLIEIEDKRSRILNAANTICMFHIHYVAFFPPPFKCIFLQAIEHERFLNQTVLNKREVKLYPTVPVFPALLNKCLSNFPSNCGTVFIHHHSRCRCPSAKLARIVHINGTWEMAEKINKSIA